MSIIFNTMKKWSGAAVILLSASPLMAQIESGSGLIRITDKAPPGAKQVQMAPASMTKTVSQCQTCNQGNQSTGSFQHSNCPSCDYSSGNCPNCYGRPALFHGHLSQLVHGCSQSPGTGYVPPGKIPINRTAIGYTQWYPSYWSGNGYGTPVPFNPAVAIPTDTTQLGYYYNHVPTWQPKPGMIPPVPHPDQWHIRRCNNNQNSQQNCPQQGHVINHEVINNSGDLKSVPDHITSPMGPVDTNGKQLDKPAPVKEADPMALFPQSENSGLTPVSSISFPELDVIAASSSDVDQNE